MSTRPTASVAFMLRALRYRNYRLFFGGQIVSLAGSWITTTATSWLVYRLTGSAVLLGLVGFAGQFPAFLLGPFAGILVDRWDRRRLLVVTQVISMIESFALAALTLSGRITVEWILVAQRRAGHRQRVRHAGAAGVPQRDDREQGRTCRTRSRSTRRWSTWRGCSGRRLPAS